MELLLGALVLDDDIMRVNEGIEPLFIGNSIDGSSRNMGTMVRIAVLDLDPE